MIWFAIVVLTFGGAWVIKFIVQRGVEDGIRNVRKEEL